MIVGELFKLRLKGKEVGSITEVVWVELISLPDEDGMTEVRIDNTPVTTTPYNYNDIVKVHVGKLIKEEPLRY